MTTRQDAHERATLMASTLTRRRGEAPDEGALPHDPERIDAAQRVALLRLARRIELLRIALAREDDSVPSDPTRR